MPTDRDPQPAVRLGPEGRRKLEALAAARGVSLSRCLRLLTGDAAIDEPPRPRRQLSEQQLPDLLRERAEDGTVSAIKALLEIERHSDPRQAALDALQQMAATYSERPAASRASRSVSKGRSRVSFPAAISNT